MYWECGECGGVMERPCTVCPECGLAVTPLVPAGPAPVELESMRALWLRAGFNGHTHMATPPPVADGV